MFRDPRPPPEGEDEAMDEEEKGQEGDEREGPPLASSSLAPAQFFCKFNSTTCIVNLYRQPVSLICIANLYR